MAPGKWRKPPSSTAGGSRISTSPSWRVPAGVPSLRHRWPRSATKRCRRACQELEFVKLAGAGIGMDAIRPEEAQLMEFRRPPACRRAGRSGWLTSSFCRRWRRSRARGGCRPRCRRSRSPRRPRWPRTDPAGEGNQVGRAGSEPGVAGRLERKGRRPCRRSPTAGGWLRSRHDWPAARNARRPAPRSRGRRRAPRSAPEQGLRRSGRRCSGS